MNLRMRKAGFYGFKPSQTLGVECEWGKIVDDNIILSNPEYSGSSAFVDDEPINAKVPCEQIRGLRPSRRVTIITLRKDSLLLIR